MQVSTYHNPISLTDETYREFFTSDDEARMEAAMDSRLAELQRQGHTFVRRVRKIGRNEPCPCGSGKKFKKCCLGKAIEC